MVPEEIKKYENEVVTFTKTFEKVVIFSFLVIENGSLIVSTGFYKSKKKIYKKERTHFDKGEGAKYFFGTQYKPWKTLENQSQR